MLRPIIPRSRYPSPSQTRFTSPATPLRESWSLSPAQTKASGSVSLWSSSSPSKVVFARSIPLRCPHLDTFLPRTNFSRSFRNLNIPTHPSPLSRSWATSFKCCSSPPRRRRAPSTGASPPRPARPYDLPLSSPSPTRLPSFHRFRKWTCQDTIRGPRLCWRRLERPEQARH
jgi:hypothetical protein